MATSISPEEAYALLVAKRIGTSKTRVLNIFRLALHEASLIASQVDFDDEKPFTFDSYPLTKGRSDKLIRDLSQKILSEVQSSVSYAWGLSEKKYDELEKSIKGKASSFHQERALQAFLERKDRGLGLSDRVWRVTEQAKQEIEMALDLGLRKGQDAASLARTLQESLNEPSLLFRRVRDEHGELHLSSRAKAYHPGRGVYRSSYKNALRLTATETNISYRTADYLRVQELDFVRGIRVNLSKNHTLNGKPFHCICDEFAGDYPKDFKFTGWHPLCRCYTTTILSEDPEAPEDTPLVTEVPQGLRDWLDDNKDRVDRIFQNGNPAYWLRDNAEQLGLSGSGTTKKTPSVLDRAKARHESRSASEIEEIKRRWEVRGNLRKYSLDLNRVAKDYKESAPSLSDLSEKTLASIRSGELRGEELKKRLSLLAHKAEVKKQWDDTREVRNLSKLLDSPQKAVGKYGIEAVRNVYSAVEKKLYGFNGASLGELEKKLLFEIEWVEKHKKYDTWQVARDAYAKRLAEVQAELKIEAIKSQSIYALSLAKASKSKPAKLLASELEDLLSQKWKSASAIEQKAQELQKKVEQLQQKRVGVGKLPAGSPFKPSDYTQARKDAAIWDTGNGSKADAALVDVAGKQWKLATKEEKDYVYEYTHHYCNINEPLQMRRYIGHQTKEDFVRKVSSIESYIDKNVLPVDMWFTRGDDGLGVIASRIRFAGGVMPDNLESLVGMTMQEGGFMSTGSRKGKGFSHKSVVLNIYAPKGTRAAYIEPISNYGHGAGRGWDGVQRFKSFSYEHETLFQRGTKMRITKVYKDGERVFIDCEVVSQEAKPISYVKDSDIGF